MSEEYNRRNKGTAAVKNRLKNNKRLIFAVTGIDLR